MKKLILLTMVAGTFIACNSNKTETAEVSPVENLEMWLDSMEKFGDLTAEQMNQAQSEYDAAKAGINEETLTEEEKAEINEINARWDAFKNNNMHSHDATVVKVSPERTKVIITEFFPHATMANNDDFTFMTAQNALVTYQGFEQKVKMHKDHYSSDDWNFVKALYEKMDQRKNEIEKDLAGSDNLKIAAIKISLAPIFAFGKVDEKTEDKVEQKENN